MAADPDEARTFVTLLAGAVALVALAPRVSDVHNTRFYEIHHILPFEYPVLGRALFVLERAIASSPDGMARVHAVVGVAAAVVVAVVLRRAGARTAVWTTAPTLVLVGQNVDAVTCVFIALAIADWRSGRDVRAGVWVGLGAAYKIVPALLLVPLGAAGGVRRAARVWLTAVAVWLAVNLPYALADPDKWRFPYRFARLRDDLLGTVWAAFGVGRDTANTLSTVAVAVAVVVIGAAVARRRVDPLRGCALVFLAFVALNKVWQPHYLLMALVVLAFVSPRPRALRALELANLAYFVVYWIGSSPTASPAALWLTASARFGLLVVVVWELAAAAPGRAAQAEGEARDRHAGERQPLDDVGLVDEHPHPEHEGDRPHER